VCNKRVLVRQDRTTVLILEELKQEASIQITGDVKVLSLGLRAVPGV
jgi:hypothetical protein